MRKLTLFWALVFSVFISFSGTALAASAVYDDLWDVSQGAIIGSHSAVPSWSNIGDMFGGTSSSTEPGNTIFGNDNGEGFEHYVEWETPNLVTLQGFNLLAMHDSSAPYGRMFSEFNLYYGDGQGSWTSLYTWNLVETPYGGGDNGNELELEIYFATEDQVTAKYFKATFNQLGPRVVELDGYGVTGSPVPVPGAVWLLGTGLISLAGIRRRSTSS